MTKETLTKKEEEATQLAAFEISEQAQSTIMAINGLNNHLGSYRDPRAPFVTQDTAREIVPEVFSQKYNDRTDRFVMRAMVKRLADDGSIISRLEQTYSNPRSTSRMTEDVFADFMDYASRFRLLAASEEISLASSIKTGVIAFKQLGAQTGLSKSEALTLLNLSREGVFSYQAFFHCNLRLPIPTAKGYLKENPNLKIEDLMNYGYTGIQNAIEKFDETKGFKFSTYAMPWINQAIQRGTTQDSRHIYLPVHQVTALRKIISAEQVLTKELSRKPSVEELAQETGIDADEIGILMRAERNNVTSLNKVVSGDMRAGSTELGDLQEDTSDQHTLEQLLDKDEVSRLFDAAELNTDERMVLTMAFGVNDSQEYTSAEIAKGLNMTVSKVRWIRADALRKLRYAIVKNKDLVTLSI